MSDHLNRKNLLPSRVSTRKCVSAGLLLTLASAFPMTDPVQAETYTLTSRIKPTEAGINGLPSGKTYCDLTSADTLNVTGANAQLYFVSSGNLDCNIIISGNAYGNEKTGKIRLQTESTVVNLNGMVTLAGDTTVGSGYWGGNHGKLYFNGQITGAGALIVGAGAPTMVYLNNTSASKNDYAGNTQIGATGMYGHSGIPTYGGTLVLQVNEQIPDGAGKGNLVLMSWEDTRLRSKLDLNGHTETVNGLVSTDTWSVVTSSADGGKLIVGANNATSEFAGLLQGSMALEKIGTGTLTLSGTNTYTGATTISAGTLKLTGSGTLGTGAVTNNAILEFAYDSNVTFAKQTAGSGSIVKTGDGTLTLNNQSTFTGNVVVNGGTLVASASWKYVDTTVFGDYVSKTVTVNDGAELVFAAQDVVSNSGTNSPIRFIANGGTFRNSGTVYNNLANTVFTDGAQLYAADGNATWKAYKLSSKVSVLRNADGSAADAVTFSSDLTKANATYSFGHGTSIYVEDVTSDSAAVTDTNSDLIISAVITNPNTESNRTFYKDGAGILEFTAANTFNGTASIREGVLRLSGNGTLGTSAVTLGDKGTLELNVADGAEKTFTNKVTGTGKVAKTGAGTLKLNTANGFESALNISEGRADVFGTMTGALAIADGASFSPGDGIGTLTVNGLFSADDGARLVFEIGEDTSDLLVLGSEGSLEISENAVLEFLFTGEESGEAYTLIQAEDDFTELMNAEFWNALLSEEIAANWHLAVVGNTLQLLAGAGTGDTSLPEPATWALLLLGSFGLLYCRKK